jgi:hypothetical protein
LTFCQSKNELFEFRRDGCGEARFLQDNTWPTPDPPEKPQIRPIDKQERFRDCLVECMIERNGLHDVDGGEVDLKDIDMDMFYEFLKDDCNDISRNDFNQAMAYLDYTNDLFM